MNTEKPVWAKSSYTVTIKQEGEKFVARDKKGDWRTYAYCNKFDMKKPIAAQLFHAEEVKSESVNIDGSITAEIWEG